MANLSMTLARSMEGLRGTVRVSFRSRNPYKKEMKIQIAVPYASDVKNAPSIFVSGRITNVREMEGMWKCGVEFLKVA